MSQFNMIAQNDRKVKGFCKKMHSFCGFLQSFLMEREEEGSVALQMMLSFGQMMLLCK